MKVDAPLYSFDAPEDEVYHELHNPLYQLQCALQLLLAALCIITQPSVQ